MQIWIYPLFNLVLIIGLFLLFKIYIPSAVQHGFDVKLEHIKPLTAEEILKRENFLNSKRDVYFEALELVSRNLACSNWSLQNPNMVRTEDLIYPTEVEVNTVLAKLTIFTNDPQIPRKFAELFPGGDRKVVIKDIGNFVNILREDMGYGGSGISDEKYIYAFIGKKKKDKG